MISTFSAGLVAPVVSEVCLGLKMACHSDLITLQLFEGKVPHASAEACFELRAAPVPSIFLLLSEVAQPAAPACISTLNT